MTDLKRLLVLFRPYAGWMVLGVVLSLVTLIANVVLMAVSGWFIASMAIAGAAGISMNYFTPAAVIRAMAIVRTGGRYLERLVTHEATFRMLARLRHWFYEHLEPLAPARMQDYRAGDLLSRIRADIDTLENFYLRFLVPAAVAVLATLLFTAFLSFYSMALAVAELLMLSLAGLVVPLIVTRLSHAASHRQVETAARLRAHLVEGQQGRGELIVYGAMTAHIQQAEKLSTTLITDQKRLSALQGAAQGGIGLCAHGAMWLILVMAIPLIGTGQINGAQLAMLTLFALASFEAVLALPLALQTLPAVRTATRRLFEIVDTPPVFTEPYRPSPTPVNFDLHLRNVTFAYGADAPKVLKNINLTLLEGRKIAVLGPTGSGKSTLIQLLLRFWMLESGTTNVGGHDISKYRSEDLRRLFAVVPQRVHLFNTTIKNNLLIADPHATDAELERVCRLAQIHDFIVEQPQGYGTFVGEAGLKLSGGQIRRLAIARAVLKDAPILVLDEPGEGLDPALEHAVLTNVLDQAPTRSVLLITHSLSGLERMDEIFILHQGQIVEHGPPEQLLAIDGAYRKLHQHRLELDHVR